MEGKATPTSSCYNTSEIRMLLDNLKVKGNYSVCVCLKKKKIIDLVSGLTQLGNLEFAT